MDKYATRIADDGTESGRKVQIRIRETSGARIAEILDSGRWRELNDTDRLRPPSRRDMPQVENDWVR